MDNPSMERPEDLLDHRRREFHQDLELSSNARRLLAEPLIQQFFERAEASLLREWMVSERDDKDYREKIYYFVHLTREFREFFEHFLAGEQFAIQQLKEMDE